LWKSLKSTVLIPLGLAFLFTAGNLLAENSSICLDCHDDKASSLAGTAHQLSDSSSLPSPVKIECMECHDGWQTHINNPMPENISRGDSLSLLDEAALCSRCHQTPHQVAMVSTDPHQKAGLTCSSCHTVHYNSNKHLLKEDMDNYCLSCHQSVSMDFEKRSAHPLNSKIITCTDCHRLASPEAVDFAVGMDWTCQSCHDDKAGPYLYEHPVVYSYLVEGGGCTECHEPHGSVNDRLLKQPGSGLCLQCHGLPAGHLTNHSGLGAKFACVKCHTEIHGSFENRSLLDPDLGIKFFPDCYQSGCHSSGGG
jgi:DmsE family decaheme c-type cytochrome